MLHLPTIPSLSIWLITAREFISTLPSTWPDVEGSFIYLFLTVNIIQLNYYLRATRIYAYVYYIYVSLVQDLV